MTDMRPPRAVRLLLWLVGAMHRLFGQRS